MNDTRNLRLITLGVIVAVALVRAGTLFEWKRTGALEPVSFDTRQLEMSLGDSIGNAAIDGVVSKPLEALRLRLPQCGTPAYVVIPSIFSAEYPTELPSYRSVDVYRGHISDGTSHISRVISYLAARVAAPWSGSTISDDFYVRTYVPSDCAVSTDDYVEWAATVLKLGSKVAGADEASKIAGQR